MSGNPTGSNVVPMPHAATPATAAAAPAPTPAWGGPWAMNPIYPIPPGPWSSGGLPWGQSGCCPPGGMDALMKCYCDVQAATAFICSVMVQCVQTNPAVVQAIIAAIEASGSTLPLLGVTNGVEAQAGQVGEWVEFQQLPAFAAGNSTQSVTMGVLQPGDWDCWMDCSVSVGVTDLQIFLSPAPAGFSGDCGGYLATTPGPEGVRLVGQTDQGLISVPSLIVFSMIVGGATAAGSGVLQFKARRRR